MLRSLILITALSLLLLSCSQNVRPMPKEGEKSSPIPAAQETKIDPATTATLRGTVHYSGNPPAPVQIDMGMDPGCTVSSSQPNYSQEFVVNHGGLGNVYVYVKQGLENDHFPAPSTLVVLDQKGCRYEPHVLALMVGQTLRVENDDPTMHNVHAQPASNPQWNESQMPKAQPIDKTFQSPEVMAPIKCNQHPWMKAYVNVAANPLFAVTDANGNFEIKGLPPGEYTIAAVHEKLGEQKQKITVVPNESKNLNFTFSGE